MDIVLAKQHFTVAIHIRLEPHKLNSQVVTQGKQETVRVSRGFILVVLVMNLKVS